MAGRKRAAAEGTTTERRETRSSKVAKTEGARPSAKATKGTARLKTSVAHSAFKSRAVPLYVSITTTTPTLEGQEPPPADPGLLANTSLLPSTFGTGSFGWKGHKRMVVELPKAEGAGEGEKVHVTLTINAIVIGSKDMKEEEEHEGEKESAGEQATQEASGEAAEPKHGESPGGEVKDSEDNPPTGEERAEEGTS